MKSKTTIEEKVPPCSEDGFCGRFDCAYLNHGCLDIMVDERTYDMEHVSDRSLEEMIDDDVELPDALIDYDSCELALEHLMAEEFMESLSDNERYIVNCLLNGMTHQQISDTMDCTRQSVSRSVERICDKANDYLSYN